MVAVFAKPSTIFFLMRWERSSGPTSRLRKCDLTNWQDHYSKRRWYIRIPSMTLRERNYLLDIGTQISSRFRLAQGLTKSDAARQTSVAADCFFTRLIFLDVDPLCSTNRTIALKGLTLILKSQQSLPRAAAKRVSHHLLSLAQNK